MKTPRQFAKDYLYKILGDRKGFDIRDLQDEETEDEIIDELADLINKRDMEIVNQKHLEWTKEYLNNGSDAE